MTLRHGWLPDKPDARDVPIDAMPMRLARSAMGAGEHIIPSDVPIHDQGGLGSCVAHGTAACLEILRSLAGKPYVAISRLALYWFARHRDGSDCEDGGTYVRSAFASLAKTGACPEALWPYDESRFAERPDLGAIEAGYDHRVSAYYRITQTGHARLDAVELAIRSDHPVAFGTLVGQPFVDYSGAAVVWHPPAHSVGGHCMCIDGVRVTSTGAREYRLRNSWGSGWGLSGFAWAAEDYITCPDSSDFWVATADAVRP